MRQLLARDKGCHASYPFCRKLVPKMLPIRERGLGVRPGQYAQDLGLGRVPMSGMRHCRRT